MNQDHQAAVLETDSHSRLTTATESAPGRRGAIRLFGAAALALGASQRLFSPSSASGAKGDAKKKKKTVKLGRITVVDDNQTVTSDQWNEGFAQCPAGQRVISGGGYLENDRCVLTGSQQAYALPETWFAGGRCPVGQQSNLRVTAMCIAG